VCVYIYKFYFFLHVLKIIIIIFRMLAIPFGNTIQTVFLKDSKILFLLKFNIFLCFEFFWNTDLKNNFKKIKKIILIYFFMKKNYNSRIIFSIVMLFPRLWVQLTKQLCCSWTPTTSTKNNNKINHDLVELVISQRWRENKNKINK